MIINEKRALAHIQKIEWVRPIEGADNIELVGILGWVCIAKIGEFKQGDYCVYFEIDSKLPEEDWSEFMRAKHFKVKTMKLGKFKVISQGLALPLGAFPYCRLSDVDGLVLIKGKEKVVVNKNVDLTDFLGVKYSAEEDNKRKSDIADKAKYASMAARKPHIFKRKWARWMMKREWGRRFMFLLFGRKKDTKTGFPTHFPFISKTDEERIENMPYILENKEPWIKTEKLDGTSTTFILERVKNKFGKERYEFYVLSRNVRQMKEDQSCFHETNVYWEMAKKYNIEEKLIAELEQHPELSYVCLQGETVGLNLQGNIYHLEDVQFFGFNYIDSKKGRWNTIEARDYWNFRHLQWVPVICENYMLPSEMEEIKLDAEGRSLIGNGIREGFVYRSLDGKQSFKNVSRKYLLKKGE